MASPAHVPLPMSASTTPVPDFNRISAPPAVPPDVDGLAKDMLTTDLPPLPDDDDDTNGVSRDESHSESSALLNHEMSRQLMDIESSFLPEAHPQPQGAAANDGADDTFLFAGSPGNSGVVSAASEGDADLRRVLASIEDMTRPRKKPKKLQFRSVNTPTKAQSEYTHISDVSRLSEEPPTPAEAYKTPALQGQDVRRDISISADAAPLENSPSSPSAQASRRSQSKAIVQVADISSLHQVLEKGEPHFEPGILCDNGNEILRPTSSASTVKAPGALELDQKPPLMADTPFHDQNSIQFSTSMSDQRPSDRPSFLKHRNSSQRSSLSSLTNHSDMSADGASTASLGADYALQTGGAMPRSNGPQRNSLGLSRLPSLGSIASSMSVHSENGPWERNRTTSVNIQSSFMHPDGNLGRLEEEVISHATPPETPRVTSLHNTAPTDTVITRHVQGIHVPETVAREFRSKHAQPSDPRHLATPFTRTKHSLTLKEQNSKIDKLSKENFDLKLKIHFLDQALQNRSDEGVKEMISKNVQLQTDLATEKKDAQALRKKCRELDNRLKAQEEGLSVGNDGDSGSEKESNNRSRQGEMEQEIEFLRERLESAETLTEQWQQEVLDKEADLRRMKDYLKTMPEKHSVNETAGLQEAANMWKSDFEDERVRREQAEARCEQAEAEVETLREEVQQLSEHFSELPLFQQTNQQIHKTLTKAHRTYHPLATHSSSESESNEKVMGGSTSGTSGTMVGQLKITNEELRRDLSAQMAMLKSRLRENTRLREENEGLKLTIRRGDAGSAAGDSILERSISRNHMRSVSRASGVTPVTQISDSERDNFEALYTSTKDELLQAKLTNKELDEQLNGHLDLLEISENRSREMEAELEALNEDLQAISIERDEALDLLQEKEQECEELRQEAQETIQKLEQDGEQNQHERDQALVEAENIAEDFNSLQQEMKLVSESLVQLEDDRDANLRRIQILEAELADANQELNRQDRMLSDERSKNEKFDIQLESCQGEIAFLRDEQEGDKIKIGELEASLQNAQMTIQDEKERQQDLEERIAEEQRQRDVLESQEKQELDKIMTELNMQLTKLKEDNRKLRKSLSSKEVEASTWKQRLDELDDHLRETLGNPDGTHASLFKGIVKLQRDLEVAVRELEITRTDLAEKDRILRNRDMLLENTGLESKRLAELLERERQGRRQDHNAFENAKRGHQSVSRTVHQHETRVLELETLRSQDRQRFHSFEKQYKEQLLERNNLLYALWNRLSTLCGAEWCRNNALINGELTSMELISKNIQGFNRNMILAVKTVESVIGGFKQRIRSIEKDLLRDYQTLEHTLDVRLKRLDQLEKVVTAQKQSIGRPSTVRGGLVDMNFVEVTKLRNENKTLRSEVQTLRSITSAQQPGTESTVSRSPSRNESSNVTRHPNMAQTLLRAQSASVVEHLQSTSLSHPYPAAGPLQTSEQKWIHRLKELERRLKAEREARVLDRSGARKRLEEKSEENADLRKKLEREQGRRDDDNLSVVERAASAVGHLHDRSERSSVIGNERNKGRSGLERTDGLH